MGTTPDQTHSIEEYDENSVEIFADLPDSLEFSEEFLHESIESNGIENTLEKGAIGSMIEDTVCTPQTVLISLECPTLRKDLFSSPDASVEPERKCLSPAESDELLSRSYEEPKILLGWEVNKKLYYLVPITLSLFRWYFKVEIENVGIQIVRGFRKMPFHAPKFLLAPSPSSSSITPSSPDVGIGSTTPLWMKLPSQGKKVKLLRQVFSP